MDQCRCHTDKQPTLLWDSIEHILYAGVRTHPEVIHSLADPAVLLRDLLLKVLIEAGLHRGELGERWPVVLFSCQTEKKNIWINIVSGVSILTVMYNNLPPVLGALPVVLFCNSCSFRSSSAAFLSSSSCCLIRLAWPAAAVAWQVMEKMHTCRFFVSHTDFIIS